MRKQPLHWRRRYNVDGYQNKRRKHSGAVSTSTYSDISDILIIQTVAASGGTVGMAGKPLHYIGRASRTMPKESGSCARAAETSRCRQRGLSASRQSPRFDTRLLSSVALVPSNQPHVPGLLLNCKIPSQCFPELVPLLAACAEGAVAALQEILLQARS